MQGASGLGHVRSQEQLDTCVRDLIAGFRGGSVFSVLSAQRFTRVHYARLMFSIFHQSFHAPLTFAMAGAGCRPDQALLRHYLLEHAVEEQDHWRWALEDLAAIGEDVAALQKSAAEPATAAFIAFNYFVASRLPHARIGTALFLEALSAEVGPGAVKLIQQQAGLTREQMSFFVSHAETDQGHARDLRAVVVDAGLSADEYGELAWAATTSARLYMNMYDEAVSDAR
jgi:pyrroloquinoline quinone (PQQ) biosynthesis protein C